MIFNLITILPELSLTLMGFLMILVGVFKEKRVKETKPVSRAFTLGVYIAFTVFFCAYFYEVWNSYKFHGFAFNGFLASDRLSVLAQLLLVGSSALWLGLKTSSTRSSIIRAGIKTYEYPILALFMLIGSFLVVSSNDFLVLFLALELQAIPLYIMVTCRLESQHSSEAGIKYFIFGALASGLILIGSAFLYGYGGTTNFNAFATLLLSVPSTIYETYWLEAGFLLVLAGLLIKLGAFPFHSWALDVYEGSANVQVALLATVPKISVIIVLARFFLGSFTDLVAVVQPYMLWVAAASVIWGAVGALRQTNLRRLIGYASIHNIGFILIPLCIGSFEGVQISLEYLMVYTLSTIGVFIGISSLHRDGLNIDQIKDLRGLWAFHPKVAILIAICLLSFAGIPPLAGFWVKFHVFKELLKSGFLGVSIALALASVVAVFYYLNLIRNIFFEQEDTKLDKDPCRFDMLLLITVILITFPLYQEKLLKFIEVSLYAI